MLYLTNATHVDAETLAMRVGHLAVEPGPGGGVAFVDSPPPGANTVDCSARIVTRSFVAGHHHVYSALARGMPPPSRTPSSFIEILERIWWHLDKQLDTAMIRASALVVAAEAARCGCTFVIDHHASPNAATGSLHVIADAFREVGIGLLGCYELSDRDGPGRLEAGWSETESFLDDHQGLVGLHASFTVSEALLERAVALARDRATGVHIHVAEAASDGEHCRATFGKSVAERLGDAGALDLPQTLLAHCLHLADAERKRIRESAAWVVQNTESNQNNAVGRFDPRGLGDRLFLGTDGMHSDMIASTRSAYLDGQSTGGLSPLDAYRRLRRVHDYLAQGDYAGDSDNNLVLLDYPSPTPITPENWAAHFVYGLSSRNVHTVISDGMVVVDAGQVTTIDHETVLADARAQAERLWRRL